MATPEPPSLKREIGLLPLSLIAIGACIGSGIFLTPSDIASKVPDASGILLAWALGGVAALTGSLTFAELGGRMPGDGGVYAYLRHMFGPLVAFLYGWVTLTVITSGALAALALASARYLAFLVPSTSVWMPQIGTAILGVFTLVNIFGVRWGAHTASVLTLAKMTGILAIIIAGLFWAGPAPAPEVTEPATWGWAGLGAALVGVFWSFGGWHHASYLAGEVRDARRVVPRAMILGSLAVTLLYLLVNLAYLNLLGPAGMAASPAVAADAIGRVFSGGGRWIAMLIMVSTLGAVGIYTLSAPRIYQVMAKDGSFLPVLARIHPRYRTPYLAILIQSFWAVILLWFWTTFESLIGYVVFMDILFMVLAAAGIFLLRRNAADAHTGFRVPGYPWVPLVYTGLGLWFLSALLVSQPDQAWAGLALCGTGIPVYLWFRRRRPDKEDLVPPDNHGLPKT